MSRECFGTVPKVQKDAVLTAGTPITYVYHGSGLLQRILRGTMRGKLTFWGCRSHIPVIKSGLPGKQDDTSVAKNTVKEKLGEERLQ